MEESKDSSSYQINAGHFWKRLSLLHAHWQQHLQHRSAATNPYPGWNECECILILCGKSDDAGYKRNNAIHIWLFGYELLSTIIVITRSNVYICAGSKTSATLQQLLDSEHRNKYTQLAVQLITKNKTDGYRANFEQLVQIMDAECTTKHTATSSLSRIGVIREEMKGFAEKFMSHLSACQKYELVEFGEALSDVMMFKDKHELSTLRKVAELTSLALKHFQKTMEKLIERNKTQTHVALSNELLKILENPKLVKSSLKNENLDVCYDPIIQSGGVYKLKPSAESTTASLHYEYGTIVVMMGFRLRDYCANIARSFIIDASREQKEMYAILVTVFKKGLLMLRDNVELTRVYEKCVATVEKCKYPWLVKHFLKSCGWGIGLEFRDKNYLIKKNNKRQCKAGMVFNFQVGFENLVDAKKKARGLGEQAANYSIILADTVLVTDDQPEFLTKFNRKLLEYELNGDMNDDEKNQKNSKKKKKSEKQEKNDDDDDDDDDDGGREEEEKNAAASYLPADDNPYRRVTRQSNRKSVQEQKQQLAARRERMKKQDALRAERMTRLQQLLAETDGELGGAKTEQAWVDPKIFADSSELPTALKNGQLRVYVDLAHECIICPIQDHCVPFHISCIKNFSILSSMDGTYLRLNFVCPQPVSSSNSSRVLKQPPVFEKHRDQHFIKELTYRNSTADLRNNTSGVGGGGNLQFVYSRLRELQKQHKERKKHAALNVSMPRQDRLQRAPSARVLILKELSLKPNLGGGRKKGTGRLETHLNGFKYADHKKNELFVLFNNIKNAIFQKSNNTTAVIVHFHLKQPIMIGKKPSRHVQCYRDVIERFEELGRGRRRYDYDGMRAEQEEEKRIKRTNLQFKQFCDRSQAMAKENGFEFEFERPNFDLLFHGVPNKQSTTMLPTSNCLVALEDSPAFVIDTSDIELCHFERVSYSLRNFDLVFVYRDFTQEPHRVTTIPREYLDTLQEFLSWKNVLYSSGKINLDWKTLMQKIRGNLEGFIESGGWDFLLQQDENYQAQNHGGGGGGDEEDEAAARNAGPPSEDEYVPDDGDDYSDDYSDEDDEDDEDDDDEDDDDEDDDLQPQYDDDEEDEEDEGLDWDELDRRAAMEDKRSMQKETESSRKERISERNQEYRRENYNTNSSNKKRRRY